MFDVQMTATARRAFMLGAGCLAVTGGMARATPRTPPRVLFICQYGSVKSPIAREILRRRARERGVSLETFSRGITPEAHLPLEIARRLLAEGIDTRRDGLHPLTAVNIRSANLVVIFNPLPTGLPAAEIHDWTSVPSVLNTYPAAIADIGSRVDSLVESLAASEAADR